MLQYTPLQHTLTYTIKEKRVVVLNSVFTVAPIITGTCVGFLFCDTNAQYFVSFLVLQSSRWGRESWTLYLYCLYGVAVPLVDQYAVCDRVMT